MAPLIRKVLRFSFASSALVLTMLMSTLGAQSKPRALFNGKNLEGWEHVGPGSFVVEDGLLKTRGGMGLLWYTQEKIQHATVRVVFRLMGKDADSGLFIRIPEKPSEPWMPVNHGYEAEIGDWPDEYSRAGVLYSFTRTPSHPLKPLGEWNTMEVTVDGPHTIIFVNGEKIRDFQRGRRSSCQEGVERFQSVGLDRIPAISVCRTNPVPRWISRKFPCCFCRSSR